MNYHACKYLLTSIKNAPLDKDHQKKKTAERQNIPQETATHLSDAFDYALLFFVLEDEAYGWDGAGEIGAAGDLSLLENILS